jgi:hypothetical protein
MRTSHYLLPLLATFAVTATLSAKEDDPASAEAGRLMQQASQAKAEGRYDEARELHEKAKRISGEARDEDRRKEGHDGADRPERPRLSRMKGEIEELKRAGKHEEAERLARHLRDRMGREDGPDFRKPDGEGPARIRHTMEAVRHLRAAGLNEPAEKLEQHAARMKEEFQQRRGGEDGRDAGKDKGPDRSREVQELQEQVQKLSRELEKLRHEVEKAPKGENVVQ